MKHTVQSLEALIHSNVGVMDMFEWRVAAIGPDRVELHIPFAQSLTRLGGTISGPVMMTAADTAMYGAVIMASERGEFGVTSHMNIEFLRRPPAAGLQVSARVLRAGKRQVSCAVEFVSDMDERLVAHVTGAYVLFDQASKSQ